MCHSVCVFGGGGGDEEVNNLHTKSKTSFDRAGQPLLCLYKMYM